MGDVSQHFSRHEFACKCGCGFAAVDVALLEILEEIRQQWGMPVVINSGCRCESHNRRISGSVERSYHVRGMAADIKVGGVLAEYVADYLEEMHPAALGIGRYGYWTHIDVGPRRRWRDHYTRAV